MRCVLLYQKLPRHELASPHTHPTPPHPTPPRPPALAHRKLRRLEHFSLDRPIMFDGAQLGSRSSPVGLGGTGRAVSLPWCWQSGQTPH